MTAVRFDSSAADHAGFAAAQAICRRHARSFYFASFFLKRFAGELKKRVDGISNDALKLLMRYNWPGNIRELENAVERAVLLTEGPALTAGDLRLGELSTTQGNGDAAPVVKIPPTGIPLEEIERQAIVEALKMSNWVQKDAAELLDISPRVMNYKIKTLGIELPRRRVLHGPG